MGAQPTEPSRCLQVCALQNILMSVQTGLEGEAGGRSAGEKTKSLDLVVTRGVGVEEVRQ